MKNPKKNSVIKKVDKRIICNFFFKPDKEIATKELKKLQKKLSALKEAMAELEEYENYLRDKADKGMRSHSKSIFFEMKMQGKAKTIELDLSIPESSNFRRPRIRVIKYCECGNYHPKSIRGVLDSHCGNCGGQVLI